MPLHGSHWGTFHVEDTAGGLDARPDAADPDPARPLLRNVPGMLDDRVRVLRPYVRRGWLEHGAGPDDRRGRDTYVPVSWERALALAAGELDRCRRDHGNASIYGGSYGWGSAGRFHHAQSQVHRFLNVLGGYVRSVNTYSLGASRPLLRHVVGNDDPITGPTSWPVLAEHTGLFVCFGGIPAKNMQVNSGGLARHTVPDQLRRARDRGARFVLVSPLRDDLAPELAADWIAPVPGTDTALMLALAHTLVSRGLHDGAFLRTHCMGFDEWCAYLSGSTDGTVKDAAWAAPICGVPADRIVALAETMAAHRTMINVSWSLQRARYGEQPLWAGIALACVLGQIGLPGGGFGHGYGATGGVGGRRSDAPLPTLPQGDNPVPAFIPVARIADMLLHPGEEYEYDGARLTYPRIRLVYWAGGNPFHHHQDLARLRRAFTRPDTVIAHEQFWTATARHADIVLPASTTLERDDLGCARDDDILMAMPRVTAPRGQARSDFTIFRDLAERLGAREAFDEGRDEREWLAHLYDTWRAGLAPGEDPGLDFAAFWATGRIRLPRSDGDRVLYADFRADPDAHPLPTPSGRIEIGSAVIASYGYDDCPGHPTWLVPDDLTDPPGTGPYPLFLIANNPATRLHSQLDHGPGSASSKISGREPLRMHPLDAAARGLTTGDVVRITSAVGSALAGVELSADIAPGVVRLSTGAWFDPSAPDVATCIHGNPNALTRDRGTSRLTQACTGHLTRVEIHKAPSPLPPVRAYEPPTEHDAPSMGGGAARGHDAIGPGGQ